MPPVVAGSPRGVLTFLSPGQPVEPPEFEFGPPIQASQDPPGEAREQWPSLPLLASRGGEETPPLETL